MGADALDADSAAARAAEGGMSMGVYIKMEMPENCALCPVWDAGNCLVASEAIICEYTKRPADCPLVPVQPHGRLGDLDKLENGLRHMAKYQRGERQQGILGCCETIRLAPTIIQAEEDE